MGTARAERRHGEHRGDGAEAARQRGYSDWNVADHSTGLGMVGGLDNSACANSRTRSLR